MYNPLSSAAKVVVSTRMGDRPLQFWYLKTTSSGTHSKCRVTAKTMQLRATILLNSFLIWRRNRPGILNFYKRSSIISTKRFCRNSSIPRWKIPNSYVKTIEFRSVTWSTEFVVITKRFCKNYSRKKINLTRCVRSGLVIFTKKFYYFILNSKNGYFFKYFS